MPQEHVVEGSGARSAPPPNVADDDIVYIDLHDPREYSTARVRALYNFMHPFFPMESEMDPLRVWVEGLRPYKLLPSADTTQRGGPEEDPESRINNSTVSFHAVVALSRRDYGPNACGAPTPPTDTATPDTITAALPTVTTGSVVRDDSSSGSDDCDSDAGEDPMCDGATFTLTSSTRTIPYPPTSPSSSSDPTALQPPRDLSGAWHIVGGTIYEFYSVSGCGLVSYIALHEGVRGRGVGSALTKVAASGIRALAAQLTEREGVRPARGGGGLVEERGVSGSGAQGASSCCDDCVYGRALRWLQSHSRGAALRKKEAGRVVGGGVVADAAGVRSGDSGDGGGGGGGGEGEVPAMRRPFPLSTVALLLTARDVAEVEDGVATAAQQREAVVESASPVAAAAVDVPVFCETNALDVEDGLVSSAARHVVLHRLGYRCLKYAYTQPPLEEGMRACYELLFCVQGEGKASGPPPTVSRVQLKVFLLEFGWSCLENFAFVGDVRALHERAMGNGVGPQHADLLTGTSEGGDTVCGGGRGRALSCRAAQRALEEAVTDAHLLPPPRVGGDEAVEGGKIAGLPNAGRGGSGEGEGCGEGGEVLAPAARWWLATERALEGVEGRCVSALEGCEGWGNRHRLEDEWSSSGCESDVGGVEGE